MAPSPTIPIGFAFLGVSVLLVTSGLKGKSVQDVLKGNTGPALNPAGGSETAADAARVFGPDSLSAADPLTHTGVAGMANTQPLPVPVGTAGDIVVFDGIRIAGWIAPCLIWARKNGWTGHVTSGIRDVAAQKQACINVCGNPNGCPGRCAVPGTSNHQGYKWPQGAVDVDPGSVAQLERVLARYPGRKVRGGQLPADPVHFSWTGH